MTPKLALNFTSAVLDPRITFSRTGATATRVNASGLIETVAANTARFEFNPITLVCRGLLVEEQRTNLCLRSDDFANAYFNKSGATVSANSVNSPDGTLTADTLVASATTGAHVAFKQSLASSGAISISVYAKRKDYDWLFVSDTLSTNNGAFFNIATGAVGIVGPNASATITPAGGGWYRCVVTTTAGAGSGFGVYLAASNSGAGISFAGDGTSGTYIWGAQVEAGASATSYIPTVASTVTRNADVAVITGSNFSDFWQATKGGAQVQVIPSTVSGIRPLVQYDDNTANEIIALRGNTTNPELYIVDGGAPQAQLDAGTIAANTAYSLTGWWDTNDCKARKDSGAVVTDNTATIPTVTQARIGSDGTNYLNGIIATINYYDSFFGQPIYTRRKNKVFPSLL